MEILNSCNVMDRIVGVWRLADAKSIAPGQEES